jgi:pimeloyl-ACP methyl ester carboxylesterase
MSSLRTEQAVVEIDGGLLIPYLERGDPDGLPVVLLHGITDSHRSFEPVLETLPSSIRAVAITARGHGDAGKPHGLYDQGRMATDVIAVMDALGIERAIVAGHSMGSWTAQRVAAAYPERVLGAVLLGAFASFHDKPEMLGLLEEFDDLGDPIDRAYARAWQDSTMALPAPETFMEMVVDETCKPPARVWKAALLGLIADRPQAAGAITAPTLLCWGERDAFVPRADQDELLSRIPGAELRVYEGGGHALHWERPGRFAADLVEFAATRTAA